MRPRERYDPMYAVVDPLSSWYHMHHIKTTKWVPSAMESYKLGRISEWINYGERAVFGLRPCWWYWAAVLCSHLSRRLFLFSFEPGHPENPGVLHFWVWALSLSLSPMRRSRRLWISLSEPKVQNQDTFLPRFQADLSFYSEVPNRFGFYSKKSAKSLTQGRASLTALFLPGGYIQDGGHRKMGIRRAAWSSGNVRKEPCALCHCSRIQGERRGSFPRFTEVSRLHTLPVFYSVSTVICIKRVIFIWRNKCMGWARVFSETTECPSTTPPGSLQCSS